MPSSPHLKPLTPKGASQPYRGSPKGCPPSPSPHLGPLTPKAAPIRPPPARNGHLRLRPPPDPPSPRGELGPGDPIAAPQPAQHRVVYAAGRSRSRSAPPGTVTAAQRYLCPRWNHLRVGTRRCDRAAGIPGFGVGGAAPTLRAEHRSGQQRRSSPASHPPPTPPSRVPPLRAPTPIEPRPHRPWGPPPPPLTSSAGMKALGPLPSCGGTGIPLSYREERAALSAPGWG